MRKPVFVSLKVKKFTNASENKRGMAYQKIHVETLKSETLKSSKAVKKWTCYYCLETNFESKLMPKFLKIGFLDTLNVVNEAVMSSIHNQQIPGNNYWYENIIEFSRIFRFPYRHSHFRMEILISQKYFFFSKNCSDWQYPSNPPSLHSL